MTKYTITWASCGHPRIASWESISIMDEVESRNIECRQIEQNYQCSGVWDLLQIADSAFPTGGFSHSVGLEAAVKHGHVINMETFSIFIRSALQNAASFSLPYVTDAYRNCQDLGHIVNLDHRLQAYTSNHVARRASTRQGTSLLSTSCAAFENKKMKVLQMKLEEEKMFGHHAPVLGFICGHLGIPLLHTQQMLLFTILRTIISSAIRLGHIGPVEAQNLHFGLKSDAEKMRKQFSEFPVEKAANTAPVVDIIQATHDELFSKLFYS